jgi:hypothetical protein
LRQEALDGGIWIVPFPVASDSAVVQRFGALLLFLTALCSPSFCTTYVVVISSQGIFIGADSKQVIYGTSISRTICKPEVWANTALLN